MNKEFTNKFAKNVAVRNTTITVKNTAKAVAEKTAEAAPKAGNKILSAVKANVTPKNGAIVAGVAVVGYCGYKGCKWILNKVKGTAEKITEEVKAAVAEAQEETTTEKK